VEVVSVVVAELTEEVAIDAVPVNDPENDPENDPLKLVADKVFVEGL
jgi:hypothetical protein